MVLNAQCAPALPKEDEADVKNFPAKMNVDALTHKAQDLQA